MGKHVIVGAGQVGGQLAELLTAKGHDVTVVTRSGSGPDGVRKVAASAADRDRLIEVTRGADTLYNCMNPRYLEWAEVWPPVAASLLDRGWVRRVPGSRAVHLTAAGAAGLRAALGLALAPDRA